MPSRRLQDLLKQSLAQPGQNSKKWSENTESRKIINSKRCRDALKLQCYLFQDCLWDVALAEIIGKSCLYNVSLPQLRITFFALQCVPVIIEITLKQWQGVAGIFYRKHTGLTVQSFLGIPILLPRIPQADWKGLEHPGILVSAGDLETTPCGYWEPTVFRTKIKIQLPEVFQCSDDWQKNNQMAGRQDRQNPGEIHIDI